MRNISLTLLVIGLISCGEKRDKLQLPTPDLETETKDKTDPVDIEADEEFEVFDLRFHEDTLFQLARIKFPLKGQKVRNYEIESWTKDNWEFLKVRADKIDTTEYKCEIKKEQNKVMTRVYIPDSEVNIISEFIKENGKWYLVRHDDSF